MSNDHASSDQSIVPGKAVYDESGRLLGHVSEITEGGFEAEIGAPSPEDVEVIPGQEFGEGFLMWRCGECGEMAEIDDGMPGACPVCGAPSEAVQIVQED
jgi:rubrerythrin